MRRFAFAIVTALAVGPAAFAQAPAAFSPTAEDTKWVQSRVGFLAMMYDLSPEQRTALDQMATKLVPDQAAYQNDPTVRQSTRSLMTAMESALSDQGGGAPVSENLRGTVVERLNGQLYAIYAKAPLSYANLTAKLDPTLPKDKVNSAQAKMKANFADRLRKSGAELSPATIDMLAGQAVELPSLAIKKIDLRLPPAVPTAPPAVAAPPPPQAKVNPVPPPTPPTPPVAQAPVPPVPLPQNPPRNYGAAPAVDTWASHVDSLTQKYKFTPEQMAKAKTILEGATKRASFAKESNADAITKVNTLPDGPDKTKRLDEINKPINETFGVMNDRIVSLASIQQRVDAEGDGAFRPAAPIMPNVPAAKPAPMPTTVKPVSPPGAAPAKPAEPAKPVEPAKPADGHSHDDGHKH